MGYNCVRRILPHFEGDAFHCAPSGVLAYILTDSGTVPSALHNTAAVPSFAKVLHLLLPHKGPASIEEASDAADAKFTVTLWIVKSKDHDGFT